MSNPGDKTKLFYLIYAGILVFAAGITVELGARILLKNRYNQDERTLQYTYDSEVGWTPRKNRDMKFTGSRLISVHHNSRGFRDVEHTPEKNKARVLFVGDSFVWGYDVEAPERFTDKLQARLPGKEVINLGVSGYGTDQEYLILKREFDYYRPDVVYLMFCGNDREGNRSNVNYGYYKPYFGKENGQPQLRGVPVPKHGMYQFR